MELLGFTPPQGPEKQSRNSGLTAAEQRENSASPAAQRRNSSNFGNRFDKEWQRTA
jgi:hypothetical protein